ncbi:MAG: hypothetical protein R3C24_01615 [Cyanobacteriota/Melainabacteria group bacterium]
MPSAEAISQNALASTQTYGGKQGTGQRIMGAIQKAAVESITGWFLNRNSTTPSLSSTERPGGIPDAVADALTRHG